MKALRERPACHDLDDSDLEEMGITEEAALKLTDKFVLITPDCCEKSKTLLAPYVVAPWADDDGKERPPYWAANIGLHPDIREWQHHLQIEDKAFYDALDDRGLKFCPYCGTKLPNIIKVEDHPKEVRNVDDCGHNVCCDWPRSYGKCQCWPPEIQYDIEQPKEQV